jgi:hypothetical protein
MNETKIPSDDELDRFLAAAFGEPPLPDRDFISALSERLRRYRRRRRWAVGVVLSLGTAATALGLQSSPTPFEVTSLVSPEAIVLTLVLTALCSLVWIGTESRTLRTTPNAARAR